MVCLVSSISKETAHVLEKSNIKTESGGINSAVVIPALNPMEGLVDFVCSLLKHGIPEVIVVNDGSDDSFDNIFSEIEKTECCTVLRHEQNRGKGQALKTAFAYFLNNFSYLDGVVTADADGQHTVEDICIIGKEMSKNKHCLILGKRDFSQSDVPKRSLMGNRVTSFIFHFLYNSKLEDTQTGLRGIPKGELSWITQMKGDRYDFEINMLIEAKQRSIEIIQIPIKTVYFDNNSGSHFSTVKDAARVFRCLISGLVYYANAAIASGVVDILGFFLLNTFILSFLPASLRIFLSTLFARALSSFCNYTINRKMTFGDTGKILNSVARYYVLCVSIMLISFVSVYSISLIWAVNASVIKLIVDAVLGIISYQVQMRWVFRNKGVSKTIPFIKKKRS